MMPAHKLTEEDRRVETVRFRCTTAAKEAIHRAAQDAGQPDSEWMRDVLLRHTDHDPHEP